MGTSFFFFRFTQSIFSFPFGPTTDGRHRDDAIVEVKVLRFPFWLNPPSLFPDGESNSLIFPFPRSKTNSGGSFPPFLAGVLL